MSDITATDAASDDDDGHWLAHYTVHCEKCQAELLMLEHSPFENGYYLYCDTCPKRVDVSVYDSTFQDIEKQVSAVNRAEDMESNYLGLVMPAVEARLRPCACTGHFKRSAQPRCLHCGTRIANAQEGFNVWFPDPKDEDIPKYEALLETLILSEDLWRDSDSST